MQKVILILGLLTVLSYAFAEVKCPDEDENSEATYFPHEIECGKFYECHNGASSLLDCAPGTYWDSRQNICSTNVDCGNLLTSTVPPPTESPPTTAAPTLPPVTTNAPEE